MIDPLTESGDLCCMCQKPATFTEDAGIASRGYCEDHRPRRLIDPSSMRIKTMECSECQKTVEYPNEAERRAFNKHHIHGNPMLQAWFDKNDAAESPDFPTDPGVSGGELCTDCGKPAVIRQDAGFASYGFCAEHRS